MVARERFELSSTGPEPAMLDRYTTGLQLENTRFLCNIFNVEVSKEKNKYYLASCECTIMST